MTATIRQLAQLVKGVVVGDSDLTIQAARTLQEAQSADITFLEKPEKLPALTASQAGAAVVPLGVLLPGRTLIQVADPLSAFIAIFRHFLGKPEQAPTGVDPRATVHPGARIGPDASIGAFASIGPNCTIGKRARIGQNVVIGAGCVIGDDVVLHPNVVLYEDCVLGDRNIIHANSVIGADGFGYRFQNGRHVKVPQLGNVVLGNDVEVGANSTIDRGAFQATIIGEGTKIDNLVQVAHNCKIGKHNILAAQCGVAGSATTGDYVILGGQVGVRDHCTIGAGAQVGAKSGVNASVPPRARMFGYPAEEERTALRMFGLMRKLPEMRKDLLRILKHLGLVEQQQQKDAA